jgi:hypothetical protein
VLRYTFFNYIPLTILALPFFLFTTTKHADRKEFAQLLNTNLSIDVPVCKPLVIDKAMLRKAAVGIDSELKELIKDYEEQRKKRDSIFEAIVAELSAKLADIKLKYESALLRIDSVARLEQRAIKLKEFESAQGALTDEEAFVLMKQHSQLKLKEKYSTPLIAGKPIPASKPEEPKPTAWERIKARQPFENDDGGYKP